MIRAYEGSPWAKSSLLLKKGGGASTWAETITRNQADHHKEGEDTMKKYYACLSKEGDENERPIDSNYAFSLNNQ